MSFFFQLTWIIKFIYTEISFKYRLLLYYIILLLYIIKYIIKLVINVL